MEIAGGLTRFVVFSLFFSLGFWLQASVHREIESEYVRRYENKALFLKLPVRGTRQVIYVNQAEVSPKRGTVPTFLSFKVGEQVRITKVDFSGDLVFFKISSIDMQRIGTLEFRFPFQLQDHFPQREAFDSALKAAFTEGLHYTEIETAKEQFIKDQFGNFVQDLADSSNSSPDFVVKNLEKEIPGYRSVKNRAVLAERELKKTQLNFQKETEVRRKLESQLRDQVQELKRLRNMERKRVTEKTELVKDRETLRRKNNQLLRNSRDLEDELKKITELDEQVRSLEKSLALLRQSRDDLTKKLNQTSGSLEKFKKDNAKLANRFRRTKKERDSLRTDLRTLTSNRKSLESRYIQMKQKRDSLETAADLRQALHFEKRLENREGEVYQVGDLYLLSKKVGTLEVRVPEYLGQTYQAHFLMHSPERVKFTNEERKLYDVLDKQLKIESNWRFEAEELKIILLENKPLQTVGNREPANWSWLFQGDISHPAQASLAINLIGEDGEVVFQDSQEFTLIPSGFINRLFYSFSPVSLGVGVISAIVIFGLIFGFRRHPLPAPRGQDSSGRQVVHKRF